MLMIPPPLDHYVLANAIITSETIMLVVIDNINQDLNYTSEWLYTNKFTLNINEAKYMLFHFPQIYRAYSHIQLSRHYNSRNVRLESTD